MGMDLALCPWNGAAEQWNHHYARAVLDLDRDYRLFAQVSLDVMGDHGKAEGVKQACQPKPLPPNVKFYSYDDDGVKERAEDNYGNGLTYVEARELAKIDLGDTTTWNKAVFEMIKKLSPRTPVVLWWH